MFHHEPDGPLMTQADRHREEGEAVAQDGRLCHHGRPAGFSNYDVRWCGACELEEHHEYMELMEQEHEEAKDDQADHAREEALVRDHTDTPS